MNLVVIVLVVGALAVLIFRRFSRFVYYIGIVDIFLKLLDYIANNVPITFLTNFINKYFPNSVASIIRSYTTGIFTTVLIWGLVIIYVILLFYLLKIFLKKK